jgi:DNA polymerase III psi subunit
MGLLDKLKPQPRWKHTDAAVRLEAVRELEDQIELAALAETDTDLRVRRAAVAKLTDPAALGRIVAAESDADARDRAADRLTAFATSPETDEATALLATRALTDSRRLSAVAKSEAPESVRTDALSRLSDERSISAVARHAKVESTARAALDRLTLHDSLVDVAEHAEHRDTALAAFDRALANGVDLAQLKSVESRAQQKAVSKRARTLIQEIEDAEAARRAAEEERRRQQSSVLDAIERLGDATDPAVVRTELARLTNDWEALGAADETASARFDRASVLARESVARREREAEEAAERARQRAEAIATRVALCARVETLEGDDVLEQLVPIEEEWRSLLPLVGNGPEADRLAERFALAVAACRKRHEMRASLAEMRTKLETLVAEAESLPSHADAASAAARWQSLSREARGLTASLTEGLRAPEDLTARLAAVDAGLAARDAARRDAVAKAQHDVVAHLQRLAERARRASDAESITLREGDRLMRDINAGLDEISRVESTREIEDAAGKLRGLQEKVAPRVRELREMDDWRRFANAQRQEQLIAMAEAIVASLKNDDETGKTSDLAATARALRELHAKWQEAAEAPRHTAQRLWDRFRTATDFIRSRSEAYFVKLREERAGNLQKKVAIVEEAEALAQSNEWGKAAGRFQALQAEWQQLGPIGRDQGRELAHRFRVACNAFFSRRREDLAGRKKAWTDNLTRKEALCERAETLSQSTEWESASSELKRLQAEWKTIGPVRRNKSDVVWNRFRAAADKFFERYHNRHQIAVAGKLAEREALVTELETVASAEGQQSAELLEKVQQLRTSWNRSVPIPAAEMKPIADRWQAAFSKVLAAHPEAFVGTDLDPAAVRQKLEKLVARVEGLLGGVADTPIGRSQAEILAARLRSALASNAMGGRGSEEAKWRAAADTVKDAQSTWQRLAALSSADAKTLEPRFRDACRKVNDQARRHGPAPRRSAKPAAAAV